MPKRIYVGNLPLKAEAADVEAAFTKIGPVASVEMKTSKDGESAVAVIVFEEELESFKVDAMNGRMVGGNKIVINHEEQYG